MKKTVHKADIRPFTRQFFKGSTVQLALAAVETLMSVAGNILVAWLIQQLLDLVAGYDTGYTIGDLIVLTAIGIASVVLAYLLAYHSKPRFISRAIGQYKEYVYRELTRKNISAFSSENSSLYISALSNDASAIETGYLSNIFPIIQNVLMFVCALVLMFWYSPLLAVISIALSLLPVFASLLVGNRVAREEENVSNLNEIYMSTLKDSLSGFSVIKSFKAEAQMCRIFGENVKRLAQANCRKRKITIIVEMLASIASVIAQLGVFIAGAYLAISGKGVTVGTVMVFVQMMNYILGPIAVLPGYFAQCSAAKGLIRKLAAALPENVRESGTVTDTVLDSGIRVENLSFSYEPEKSILSGLSCKFEVGRSYAIVGASGSGKSTLLNLLMASYPEYSGSIYYDETELRQLESNSLYELVSVIQQNVFIFNASIRDNITMFSNFPKEEVDRAIEMSGLSALIAERGEDYLCGENGSGLSGGEKQRISIARSLLKKSQVLLVDEGTAALDAQTANQVSGAILALDSITRIVVTHSLDESLLRQYDAVLALKNGTIAECGTFEQLMENRGYFYSLYTVSQ